MGVKPTRPGVQSRACAGHREKRGGGMRTRGFLQAGGVVVVGMLLVGGVAGTAMAKKAHPATSKMRFKLDSHSVAVGDQVTGSIRLWTRSGHRWEALGGVDLSVRLDGTEVDTVTTDSAGDHVIKVVYAGDDTHRKAHRAQGVEATAPSPSP